MFTVQLATPEDLPAVDALRLDAYRRAPWYELTDPTRILCGQDAPDSQVLVVKHGTTLVSTLCLTPVGTAECASEILGTYMPLVQRDLPALVVTRLATAGAYSGQRLTQVLRWHTARAALQDGVGSIVGLTAAGAPNLPILRALGCATHETHAMPGFSAPAGFVRTYLPRVMFWPALQHLRNRYGDVLSQCHWCGPALRFDIRACSPL